MHLTRPQSPKRRSRPARNRFFCPTDTEPAEKPENGALYRPQAEMLHDSRTMEEDVLHVLPVPLPKSFNRYNVLPPIERSHSKESPLKKTVLVQDQGDGRPPNSSGDKLLLAIRAPCGRRFEQHYKSSDTLLTVRSSAEARLGVSYRGAFMETATVPRRTLVDLDMTLAQCGIHNRSVLCISQRKEDRE